MRSRLEHELRLRNECDLAASLAKFEELNRTNQTTKSTWSSINVLQISCKWWGGPCYSQGDCKMSHVNYCWKNR